MKKISREEINKGLVEITQQFMNESGMRYKGEIKLDASLQRHLGIDSLGRSELFQRVEKAFDVNIPDRLLASAETLNDIGSYLEEAGPRRKPMKPQHVAVKHKDAHVELSDATSLTDVVMRYGKQAADKPHIYFQHEEGKEEILTYGELLKSSLRVAAALRALGLKEDETVAIMLPTDLGFFYAFLGTMFAGALPVPIYPPFRMHMLEAYAKTESHILSNAGVRILVTFPEAEKLSHLLQTFVPSLKKIVTVKDLLGAEELEHPVIEKENHYAFIQYTSGSTSNPKGVLLTQGNLLANVRAYGKAIKIKSDDVAVSWLPLYHDLGLIGMWLGSLYYGVPLILMAPFTFLNHPDRWLWAIHYHRGTISGAPNFAYELCARKIEPSQIEGLDLSSWRLAANGAEKVYPRTMEEFAKKFAPYGFNSNAFMPVYGLAESTVGLAVPEPGTGFHVDIIDRKQFEEQNHAEPVMSGNTLEFVSCGKPLVGHEVRVVNDDGVVLPERTIGGLQFRGPSNMQGYYNNPKATAEIYHDGWLDSGDLGYLADQEVYITGRRKDLIIKAGRNLYPAEIEEIVGNVKGIRTGCTVAFAVHNPKQGTEDLIVVAETREKNKEKKEELIAAVKEAVATTLDIVPDEVVLARPHTVPKTSSGKLQRAACKAMYEQGKIFKRQSPPWLQIVKLVAAGAGRKIQQACEFAAKCVYTFYVGLLLLLTFLPAYILIRVRAEAQAEKIARVWASTFLRLAFCPVAVVNQKNLQSSSPMILASNHASYVDAIVALSIAPPKTRFVAKKEISSMPFVGAIARKLNYLPVDRLDMPKGIEDAKQFIAALKDGYNIYIFPEGTFSYAPGLRPFRLGAFKLAVEAKAAICPVALMGTRCIFREGERLFRPCRITVTVGEPIMPEGSDWQHVTQLRDKVRSAIAKDCGESTLDFIAAQTVAPKRGDSGSS